MFPSPFLQMAIVYTRSYVSLGLLRGAQVHELLFYSCHEGLFWYDYWTSNSGVFALDWLGILWDMPTPTARIYGSCSFGFHLKVFTLRSLFFFPPKPRSLNFYSSAQYFLFILWIKQLFLNSLLPSHELGVEVENNCSILTYDFTQYSHALPVQSLRHLGGWVGPWGGATVLQGTHSFLHVSSMATGHLLYVFRPHSAYLDVFKSYTLQRWGPKGQSDNSVGRLHLPSSSNNP